MDEFSTLKEHANRLYRRTGQLKLYFHFNSSIGGFDTNILKAEIENIKYIISSIESIIEKNENTPATD